MEYVNANKQVNFLSGYVARWLNTPGRFVYTGLRQLKKTAVKAGYTGHKTDEVIKN